MAHQPKTLRVLPPVSIGGRHVKRYHVFTDDLPITDELADAAERFLPTLYPEFADDTPPATFAVFHRGRHGMYLNAYSWVWDNVVHGRTAAAGNQPFLGSHHDDLITYTELNKPLVGCVWELPAITHERDAWVRHMLAPDVPDLDGYLADVHPDGDFG